MKNYQNEDNTNNGVSETVYKPKRRKNPTDMEYILVLKRLQR